MTMHFTNSLILELRQLLMESSESVVILCLWKVC